MQAFNGRLLYMGWFRRPWKLFAEGDEIDLWPIINEFLVSLKGKQANHQQKRDSYMLVADNNSGFTFKYVPDKYVLLEKPKTALPEMFNVCAYFDTALIWLSGRLVKIEIENGKRMIIAADKSEEVLGLSFMKGSGSCKVLENMEDSVCKAGRGADCCIFLSLGAGGFRCEKFSGPMARMLLERLAEGRINAGRIGNCALVEREAEEEERADTVGR